MQEDDNPSRHVFYVTYDTFICHRILIGLKFADQEHQWMNGVFLSLLLFFTSCQYREII